ncbi:MAG TPA: tyrosine-type recombinase/integrase [Syntrophomonadaceae bacterium]|nr:tyrosine-type recombinase/integrase [Syntrophomonadaceae bacterium]
MMQEAIDKYIRRCKLRNLADSTIKGYELELTIFSNFYKGKVEDITQNDIDDYVLHLKDSKYAITTINTRLRTLRIFLRWCKADVKITLLKNNEVDITPFMKEDLKELYEACLYHESFYTYRDYVIMRTLEETGMRIGECLNLKLNHVDLDRLQIKVIDTKNGKNRVTYITPFLRKELSKYMNLRQEVLNKKGLAATSLFISQQSNPLAISTFQDRMSKYAKFAGITHVRASPHTFRHTFARNFLINGGDMFTLQEILGHSTLDMVRRYVRLFDTDKQKIYNKVMSKYSRSKKKLAR